MLTVFCAATAVVVTVNVAVVAPLGTVTDVGTVATMLLELSVTVVPVDPAGPLNVTVPVDEFPPTTAVGDKLTEFNDTTVTVIVWFSVVPE